MSSQFVSPCLPHFLRYTRTSSKLNQLRTTRQYHPASAVNALRSTSVPPSPDKHLHLPTPTTHARPRHTTTRTTPLPTCLHFLLINTLTLHSGERTNAPIHTSSQTITLHPSPTTECWPTVQSNLTLATHLSRNRNEKRRKNQTRQVLCRREN